MPDFDSFITSRSTSYNKSSILANRVTKLTNWQKTSKLDVIHSILVVNAFAVEILVFNL
jgi:hypothetical protein